MTAAFGLLATLTLIPAIDTDSDSYRQIFKRGDTYDTTYFPIGNLIYYCIMNMSGFLYVNISNMNCSRESILHSRHERKRDFYMTTLYAPIFYFLGNNIALRSERDLDQDGLEYTYWACVLYNFLLWTIAYIFGL